MCSLPNINSHRHRLPLSVKIYGVRLDKEVPNETTNTPTACLRLSSESRVECLVLTKVSADIAVAVFKAGTCSVSPNVG